MPKKEEMITDASLYSSLTILTQLITLAVGILTRRFLGPVQMGVWSLLQIILIYAAYSPLGVMEAIFREIPFNLGKGDRERADEIKNLAYSFSMFTSLLIAIACAAYAVIMRPKLSAEIFYGLLFVSALVLLQRMNNLYIALLRGYKFFSTASYQMLFSSLVNAILVAVFTKYFKVYGFMSAMCLSFLFNIAYVRSKHPFQFQWYFHTRKIWALIQYGFPIIAVSLLGVIFLSIDKMMIAKMIGLKALGLYSVPLLAFTYLGNFPNAIGIVLIPNFHQKFGETERAEDLKNYLEKSSQVFTEIMPLLIAASWFFIPYFARILLPDFEGSIPPMKYLIVGSFFLALIHPYSYFIVVLRKQSVLLGIMAVVCALAFLFNFIAIKSGLGILGVGIATTSVLLVKFTATYFLACKKVYKRSELWRNYFAMFGKFFLMLLILVTLNRLLPSYDRSLSQTLTLFGVFVLLYVPSLTKLNRDLGVFRVLKSKLSNWFASRALANP